ncbi:hypothetical protein VM1G_11205 [Cytospora mali]|uniref:Rhodopsin domain-containing protein n=1 Tax=Cytospora mali TaxID=578113 RepID=A0A194VJU3_CYTMA|nr:hypothetical protein VM1G_11205 [Valsa mali]
MADTTQGGINLLIWTIVFTIIDSLFVFLRFWAARLIQRRIYADDYLIVVALINTFALEGVLIWSVFNGMGKHTVDLTPEEAKIAYKTVPAAYVTWTLGTAAFKLSVLSLYVRLFTVRTFKRLSYIVMFLTVAYCVTFLTVFLTTCSPDISQLWNPRPNGYCRDLNIGQLGSVSTSLGVDVIIIALPMPFLWRLKMRLRNKVFVTIAFSLSFITVGIMIWRIVDLCTSSTSDFVFNMPVLALTTTLELWMCIIIACIPTLAPLLKTYVIPLISSVSKIGSSGGDGSDQKQRSIITFGRLGGRHRKIYTTILYGSQDPITRNEDVEARGHNLTNLRTPSNPNLREDAFTTTDVTAGPSNGDEELRILQAPGAIHVRRDIDTS